MGCGCCHRRGEDALSTSATDMDERTALLHTENIWNGSNGSNPKVTGNVQVQANQVEHTAKLDNARNKVPINKPSANTDTTDTTDTIIEIETGGKPKSLKERMKALEQNQNKVNTKIDTLKAERHLESVKVTASSKEQISSLFADKLEKQKKAVNATGVTAAKSKILKKALSNPDEADSAAVIQSLGLLVPRDRPLRKSKSKQRSIFEEEDQSEVPLEVLNMNNNPMMRTMSAAEKENMEDLLCHSLVNTPDLYQVQMCNADVNDAFLTKILKTLTENQERHGIKELWLESNPIGDDGMKELAQFITDDHRVTVIKLYNNKKTISTAVLNELLEALSVNMTILKFVFDGFRFQHQKDKHEKYMRRNQEIVRKLRNEERKRLRMAHET